LASCTIATSYPHPYSALVSQSLCACPCPFIHPWLYWLALIGLTSPHLYSLLLFCAHLQSFAYPHLVVLVGLASIHAHCHSFVCARLCSLFVPTWLHGLVLMLITACSCPLLYAHLHLFAGPHLSLPICVHLVVLVPAWLCLFGFCSCSLVFTWVCLCWFSFCLCLFVLCCAHLCFDQVVLGSQASPLCLYQIYVGI
jgi:hypothetical protein